MNGRLTEIVFILDRSGSMNGLEEDTIGGFNSLIAKERNREGEALVSTVLFDSSTEVIHDRVRIEDVKPLTQNEYFVRGCTALLDAVGGAIHHIVNVHRYARSEDVPERTLFVITTDGMENASRFYTREKVRAMIEKQQKEHSWEFLFLGANIDAVEEAGKIGIGKDRAVEYVSDSRGTRLNYEAVSIAVRDYRSGNGINRDWGESVRSYRKRKDEETDRH